MAAHAGISKRSVVRYFRMFGLPPNRSEGLRLSNDLFFIEKLRDVAGPYLNSPDKALVICVNRTRHCAGAHTTCTTAQRRLKAPSSSA